MILQKTTATNGWKSWEKSPSIVKHRQKLPKERVTKPESFGIGGVATDPSNLAPIVHEPMSEMMKSPASVISDTVVLLWINKP